MNSKIKKALMVSISEDVEMDEAGFRSHHRGLFLHVLCDL